MTVVGPPTNGHQETKRQEAHSNLANAQAAAGDPPDSPRATARNLSFGGGRIVADNQDQEIQPLIPINVLLIGPPASGKSTLASTLRTLSHGALRFVEELPDDADVLRYVDTQHNAYLRCILPSTHTFLVRAAATITTSNPARNRTR